MIGIISFEKDKSGIVVKWFRKKRGAIMKGIDKLFKKEVPHADLPESGYLGFYRDSERSINLLLPDDMPDKMSANSIDTIVHELWHAKQHEDARNGRVNEYVISRKDRRARWYGKNNMASNEVPVQLLLPVQSATAVFHR